MKSTDQPFAGGSRRRRSALRRTVRRAYPDPNWIKAVDLDDIAVTNEVEILPAGGLPALCSPDTHHVDVAAAVNHSITRADVAGHSDLR